MSQPCKTGEDIPQHSGKHGFTGTWGWWGKPIQWKPAEEGPSVNWKPVHRAVCHHEWLFVCQTQTHLTEHGIDVGDAQLIHWHFKTFWERKEKVMEKEIQYMFNNSIVNLHLQAGLLPVCWWIQPTTPRFCTNHWKVGWLNQMLILYHGWKTAWTGWVQLSLSVNLMYWTVPSKFP